MEKHSANLRWQPVLLAVAAVAAGVALRRVIWALALQLGAAALLTALALPLCRALEKRLPPWAAAALSLLALLAGAGLTLLLLVPPALRQLRQLTDALPALIDWAQRRLGTAQAWLAQRGFSLSAVWEGVFPPLGALAGDALSAAAGALSGALRGVGKVLLSPLMAFYLLRDRAWAASRLTLLIPVRSRARAVRAAREMRRETAGFLRGQLLLSLSVGGLTALALLLTGTPGWLVLGALMGLLELVPYVGPLLAGIPAVLLALQGGWLSALWTALALLAVQQLESAVLSPRLLSGATQLHPLTVLLAVSAGGMLGGAPGMMLVLPAIVSLRGALRGWR